MIIKQEKQTIYSLYKNYIITLFIAGFSLQLFLFWPGLLNPDSVDQYAAAQSGIYTDHHPALMSFVWRYLDLIYPGPGLMLSLNLLFLHGSAFLFYLGFKGDNKALLFVLLPWIPGVFVYGFQIIKDVSFAYSFMFIGALLTKMHMQDKKLKIFESILFFIVLFYGTSVKFQAQYLMPIFLIWYVWHQCAYNQFSMIKKASIFFVVLALFYGGLGLSNRALVPPTQQDHSWQFVKLFDLTAIGIKNNESYIPEANQGSSYSFDNMKKTFLSNPQFYYVDDLIFATEPVLQKGKTVEERDILWTKWATIVLKHPFDYLEHRIRNLAPVIGGTPQFDYLQDILNSYLEKETLSYKISYYAARITAFTLVAALPIFLLGLFYLFIAIRTLKKAREALPMLYILLVAYGMPVILLMFSMAGTARYVIISVCLIHTTHFLAWKCLRALRHS